MNTREKHTNTKTGEKKKLDQAIKKGTDCNGGMHFTSLHGITQNKEPAVCSLLPGLNHGHSLLK